VDDERPPSQDPEAERERLNRELLELLNEIRVAMPGVQVLFGFLLAVPFQQRFGTVDAFQRITYFVTLLFAAAATAMLIAPTAYHRVMFHHRDKPALIAFGNRMLIGGLACLAVAMNGAVLLVSDVIFRAPTPIVASLVLGSLYVWLWFVVPGIRRARHRRSR
jgi:hypothetical protein